MIKDDAVRFLEEINNSKEYARFGKCFKTKEKKYFYDTGTGKVCECEQEEYELLKSSKQSSSVFVKSMDFPDHVCIASKPERITLHLQKQRNAALRKLGQPSVNS